MDQPKRCKEARALCTAMQVIWEYELCNRRMIIGQRRCTQRADVEKSLRKGKEQEGNGGVVVWWLARVGIGLAGRREEGTGLVVH